MSPALDGDAPVETADARRVPAARRRAARGVRGTASAAAVQAGEVLFREGDARLRLLRHPRRARSRSSRGTARDERMIAVHGPGRFLGELSLLTGQAAFFTAVVREAGEVLAVPVERLRELVAQDPALGDLILRAYLIRRAILDRPRRRASRIVGSRYSPDTRRLREFAARNRAAAPLDRPRGGRRRPRTLLRRLGVAPEETPVVDLARTRCCATRRNAELARALGLRRPARGRGACDLVVVGAGPGRAGRRRLRRLGGPAHGRAGRGRRPAARPARRRGSRTTSASPPASPAPSWPSGRRSRREKFGAGITVPAEADALEPRRRPLRDPPRRRRQAARTRDGRASPPARATAGSPVPRLEEFEGSSVYYAATLDGGAAAARGDPVVVVGGGNSAGQAAMFLARPRAAGPPGGPRATIWARTCRATWSTASSACRTSRCCCHTEVRELLGDDGARGASSSRTTRTGDAATASTRGRCSSSSAPSRTPSWLRGSVALDDGGYILTGAERRADGERRLERAAAAGDQPARRLRRRRRAQRLDQAGRLGGRRGLDGRPPRARALGTLR